MIEFEEYRVKLNNLKPSLDELGVSLKLDPHTAQDFADTVDTIMLCYGTMRPKEYSAYHSETVIRSEKLDTAYFERDNFAGKRWLASGKSLLCKNLLLQ